MESGIEMVFPHCAPLHAGYFFVERVSCISLAYFMKLL